ncbi:hypothetical protein DAPK24_042040 [Pichia kluyveri]|uniref:Myb-like domain-containing protein n=1 Tax=Pichia kluyveri TaxID=36015 RepID=A0AAV5RAG0_PICKL|nr:hypothetical protein DAPK24_042040 [Pichia kluyveri]
MPGIVYSSNLSHLINPMNINYNDARNINNNLNNNTYNINNTNNVNNSNGINDSSPNTSQLEYKIQSNKNIVPMTSSNSYSNTFNSPKSDILSSTDNQILNHNHHNHNYPANYSSNTNSMSIPVPMPITQNFIPNYSPNPNSNQNQNQSQSQSQSQSQNFKNISNFNQVSNFPYIQNINQNPKLSSSIPSINQIPSYPNYPNNNNINSNVLYNPMNNLSPPVTVNMNQSSQSQLQSESQQLQHSYLPYAMQPNINHFNRFNSYSIPCNIMPPSIMYQPQQYQIYPSHQSIMSFPSYESNISNSTNNTNISMNSNNSTSTSIPNFPTGVNTGDNNRVVESNDLSKLKPIPGIMAYSHPLIPIIPSASGNIRKNSSKSLIKEMEREELMRRINFETTENRTVSTNTNNSNEGERKNNEEEDEKPRRMAFGSPTWTKKDDQLLRYLKETEKIGWRDISMYFPMRTINACQFRWRRLVTKDENRRKREQRNLEIKERLKMNDLSQVIEQQKQKKNKEISDSKKKGNDDKKVDNIVDNNTNSNKEETYREVEVEKEKEMETNRRKVRVKAQSPVQSSTSSPSAPSSSTTPVKDALQIKKACGVDKMLD